MVRLKALLLLFLFCLPPAAAGADLHFLEPGSYRLRLVALEESFTYELLLPSDQSFQLQGALEGPVLLKNAAPFYLVTEGLAVELASPRPGEELLEVALGSLTPSLITGVTCSGVEADQSPLDVTTTFSNNQRVYVAALFKGLTRGVTIGILWYYFDEPIQSYALIADGDYGQSWVSFSLQPQEPFPPGDYRAELYLNGAPVKTLSYSIN